MGLGTSSSRARVAAASENHLSLPSGSLGGTARGAASPRQRDESASESTSSSGGSSMDNQMSSSARAMARTERKLEAVKKSMREDPSVLRDPQWCVAFRSYVWEAYKEDLLLQGGKVGGSKGSSALGSKAAAKHSGLARQYFNFWTDLSDLEWCSEGSKFRALRIEVLLDKYLSRGGESAEIPLSSSLRSELLGPDGCGPASASVLDEARDEAFRYLSSEVLPLFTSSQSAVGLLACLSKTKRVVLILPDKAKKITAYPEALSVLQRVEQSQALKRWLAGSTDRQALTLLVSFGVEVLGYKSLLDYWALVQWRSQRKKQTPSVKPPPPVAETPEVKEAAKDEGGPDLQERFQLIGAHEIFECHLRLGLPVRAVHGLLTRLCSSGAGVTPDLFDELLAYVLSALSEHMGHFMNSVEYHEAQYFVEEEVTVSDITKEEQMAMRAELNGVLGSAVLAAKLQDFVKTQAEQARWLLSFYLEVQELNDWLAGKLERPMTSFARMTKIFMTYVKRGAPCELSVLTGGPRIRMMERMATPGALTDASALQESHLIALKTLCSQILPDFSEWLARQLTSAPPEPAKPAEGPARRSMLGLLESARSSSSSLSARSSSSKQPVKAPSPAYRGPTLSEILEMPAALAVLRKFAATECMLDPLLFWLDAEEYRCLPRQDLLLARASAMVAKYIGADATHPLGLPEEATAAIASYMAKGLVGPGLFSGAQVQVYGWMKNELLPRFAASPHHETVRLLKAVDEIDVLGDVGFSLGLSVSTGGSSEGRHSSSLSTSLRSRRSSQGPESAAAPPTTETAGGGQEGLLRALRSDRIGLSYFKEYCRRINQLACVMFWLDVEDFRNNLPDHKLFGRPQAAKIAQKYLVGKATLKVAVSRDLLLSIMQHVDAPPQDIFDQAQAGALQVMLTEMLPGFLTSSEYEELCRTLASETKDDKPWQSAPSKLGRMLVNAPGEAGSARGPSSPRLLLTAMLNRSLSFSGSMILSARRSSSSLASARSARGVPTPTSLRDPSPGRAATTPLRRFSTIPSEGDNRMFTSAAASQAAPASPRRPTPSPTA